LDHAKVLETLLLRASEEIDLRKAGLIGSLRVGVTVKWKQFQTAGRRDRIPRRPSHHPAVGGAAGDSRQRLGHPSFVLSSLFTNRTRWRGSRSGPIRASMRKSLHAAEDARQKVARLHLDNIGVKLTKLIDKQSMVDTL
jgi:hypothetical protein